MIQIKWQRGSWFAGGLLIAGLLVGFIYGQTPGGQSAAGLAPSAATAAQPSSPNKVVLKVGDESVTEGEIDSLVNSLNPQAQKSLAAQGRRSFGDQYALMILLSQEALSHHLDSTATFQHALAMARRQILAQATYQAITRNSAPTPEEISKYFAAHQSEFEEARIRQIVIRKRVGNAKEESPGLTANEAKTRAEEIRKALTSGIDPKKVADQFQIPNVVRVEVEPAAIHRGSMRADMEKAVFGLKDGQVSEVFDFPQSMVLIQLVSRKARALKDVSSEIENTLRQQKVNAALDELKKKAKVWMDEAYFSAPIQPGPQGAVKPPPPPGGPATAK